ncbi:DUF952 domain-containing protein [Aerosakkonemataceae cyanobacterium BLCC-F154]|uniref:DUF952 domain-containing protein n=1 Tax=Floridaenema fluviatile BLCC-F154 TaxID=3153640 RepID=A0ABV4YBP1_9CYAN
MSLILHITETIQWEQAELAGIYHNSTLDSEGFIHCSTIPQIERTANNFFANQTGLVLLCIDAEKVQPEIKYEVVDGEKFPHIYGALNTDAVVNAIAFPPDANGKFKIPPELAKLDI